MEFIFRYIVEAILEDSTHLPCIKGFTSINDAIEFINKTTEGKSNHYRAEEYITNSKLNNDVILCYKLYDKENSKHYATIILRDLKQII